MEYRILGNTGLSVSVIALGCEGFVGKTEEQVHSEMDFAISKGINFIDMYLFFRFSHETFTAQCDDTN